MMSTFDADLGRLMIRGGAMLLILILTMWAASGVLRKAGYSGWWALLLVIPLGGLIVLIIFSRVRWPVEVAAGWRDGEEDG